MSFPRELSQFASFLTINDANRQIAITTSSTPFVGIGSIIPTEKLDVLGNIKSSGSVSATTFYGDGSNLSNVTAVVNGFFVSTPSGIWTGSNVGIGTTIFSQRLNVDGSVLASRFISNAPQGTSPFQVFSNTLVSNLNASLLNGKSAPSGNIVGTTDSQTLSNKILSNPVISTIINGVANLTLPTSTGTLVHTSASGILTSGIYSNGSINNIHISGAAAISYSKLNLNNSITNSDIAVGASISYSKLNLSNSIKSSDIDPNNKIQNNKLSNNTISGVPLGNNLNLLIPGNYLSGNNYDGSSQVTVDINASTENSGGTLVARDSRGDITVNSIIAENGPIFNSSLSFLNRIINGDMLISQRAPVNDQSLIRTITNQNAYWIDRWLVSATNVNGTTGEVEVQSVSDAPSILNRSLKCTNKTAITTSGANRLFYVAQLIEGINVYDFSYGKPTAKTVTLSFWVKSSLTGTFSGSCRTMLGAIPTDSYRSYVFEYNINVANIWEYKTIIIPGDTINDFNIGFTEGYGVIFDLGSGDSYQTSSLNNWIDGNFIRSNNSIQFSSTLNASWQLSGVQLKIGDFQNLDMPFERLSYSAQLMECQRYYENPVYIAGGGSSFNGDNIYSMCYFNKKRVAPAVEVYSKNLVGSATNIIPLNIQDHSLMFIITCLNTSASAAQAYLKLDAEIY